MFEVSGISKKDIQEEYEDLVFRKVMAIYVRNEGKQILDEIEKENEAEKEPSNINSKAIEKLFDKKERKENLDILWKYSKKLINIAAMIVFVAIISLSSVVVAFADVRETIAEYLYYYLTYENNEKYTEIGIGEKVGFIDKEIYTWENAYALTYMADNYKLSSVKDSSISRIITYTFEENYISFVQSLDPIMHADTEDADISKVITIGNSEGFLIVKDNWTCILWSVGDTLLQVSGTAETEEMIKIAESVKIFK